MRTWSDNSDLHEIKYILSSIISKMNHEEQLIKDVVCTSYEEFQTLCKLLEQCSRDATYNRYCICIIVGWIESYRHNANERYRNFLVKQIKKIPQYALREFLTSCQYALYEYGLDTYNKDFCTFDHIEQVVKEQAGVI